MGKHKKRWIALILSVLLALGAAGGLAEEETEVPAEEARMTAIRKAYAEGDEKAMWELANTHYATDRYLPEGCAELYIWSPDGPVFAVQNSTDSQKLNFFTIAVQETAGVGLMLEQMYLYTYSPGEGWTEAPFYIPGGRKHVDPFGGFTYNVFCEAGGSSRYEIVAAAGTDDNGHEFEFYGVVQLMNGAIPAGVPDNPDYDTDSLRHEASFMLQVGDGVWWVPANELGETRYTNREIAGMTDHTPEQKQEEISTLYEAIQLFQISGFSYSEDNVPITEPDGLIWEHHKPGRDAVRTNTGCCAASADWLNYILDGDYEEMGFIGWSLEDGNGHVFNYIFQDGWYYFIDLTHYEGGIMTPETGQTAAYRYLEHPAGSVHKARTIEDYIKFYLAGANDPPVMFDVFRAENVLPLAVMEDEDGHITFYYPEEAGVTIIDDFAAEKPDVRYAPQPEKTYNWSGLKSASIKAKKKYLPAAEGGDGEPLTAYRPGDRLTLEDNSAKGTAVIDGIKYSTSRRDEVRVDFEESLRLEGERVNGVYTLRLPLEVHGEAVKDMGSVAIGEAILGVAGKVPEIQVVFCVRDGDELVVQEVMDGKYYDVRQISIRRDENGNWTDSPDCWYLIITRDRKMKYEFGRVFCAVSAGD